jgi:hypothetical protein
VSKANRRSYSTVDKQWRKPEYEEQINRYPFGIASLIAGGAAALIGLMISFMLIIAIWLLAAHGTESTIQVVRASAISWQAAHLVPILIGEIPVGILPWGFVAIPAIAIWKSMHWALKSAQPRNGRQFWLIAVFFSIFYGLISIAVSLVCSTEGLSTDYLDAFVYPTLIALIISIAVLVDYAPSPTQLTDRLPKDFVAALKPGLVAFMILWMLSALVTTVALIIKWNEINAVAGLMAPSSFDRIFLIFLCIGYLPTVMTWTFSFLLGSGVHLGGAAIITTTTATPGALPAFPLLSILPTEVIPWAQYLVAVPISIGVVIYFLIPREPWKANGESLPAAISNLVRFSEILRIFFAILVLAVCTALVTTFSGGPLGVGYLSFIGPDPIEAVNWVIRAVGIAALITLILPRLILSSIHLWTNRDRTVAKTE